MLVQPTDKWINSIAVPNCGIVRKPFNSKFADVSDDVGNWLVEAGFAAVVATEETEGAIEPVRSSGDGLLPTGEDDPLTPPEKPAEPIKSKKSSKLFGNPGES